MGLPTEVTRDHPDYPALVLAAAYLGQHRQFVGRLMQKMRSQRGLNYGNYAYAEHFEQDGWTRFPGPTWPAGSSISPCGSAPCAWSRPTSPSAWRCASCGPSSPTGSAPRTSSGFAASPIRTTPSTSDRVPPSGLRLDDAFYGVEQPWIERLRTAWGALTADDVNAALRRHLDLDRLQIAAVHPEPAAFADDVAEGNPSPIAYRAEVSESIRTEDEAIQAHPVGIEREHIHIIPVGEMFR
jgi:zinc protease